MAVPPFFSPVRIGDRHFIDAGAAQVSHLDVAVEHGAEVIVVVNPMVPVHVETVPTGHGKRTSVRDKGMMWVLNQSMRIGMHRLLEESSARITARREAVVLLLQPDPSAGDLFMYNPANFAARRNILEYAYRSTRARLADLFATGHPVLAQAGWAPNEAFESAHPAPPSP
jgi:predicted acylesterase/phospholipase RssA